MIRINLLPFRAARKKENVKRQLTLFLLTFVMVCIAIYGYTGFLDKKTDKLNDNINIAKKEINRLKKITREIAKIQNDLKILNKKILVIKGLEGDREKPIRLLEAMTGLVIAQRMWLTSLSYKGAKVETVGVALDSKTVVDFMTRLEKSELFSSVKLKTMNKRTMNKISLKSFIISCEKKPSQAVTGSEEKK
ncbi:PilN domain-containing protein [Thermodesulfobacteriota bacterium]